MQWFSNFTSLPNIYRTNWTFAVEWPLSTRLSCPAASKGTVPHLRSSYKNPRVALLIWPHHHVTWCTQRFEGRTNFFSKPYNHMLSRKGSVHRPVRGQDLWEFHGCPEKPHCFKNFHKTKCDQGTNFAGAFNELTKNVQENVKQVTNKTVTGPDCSERPWLTAKKGAENNTYSLLKQTESVLNPIR